MADLTTDNTDTLAPRVGRWGPAVNGKTGYRRAARKHWGLGDAWAWLGIALGASLVATVVGAVVVIAPALRGNPTDPAAVVSDKLNSLTQSGPFLLVSLLALWIGFFGGPLYATMRKGARSLAKDFGFYFKRADLLWGPLLGVGLLGLSALLSLAMNAVGFHASDNTGEITGIHNKAWLILLVGLGTFAAPVFEELYFRGLFQRALLNRFAKAPAEDADPAKARRRQRLGQTVSVLISSTVFGLLHTTAINQGGAAVAVQTGALGIALGVSAVKFRRLGPGIGAHLTNNGIALLIALL